MTLVHLPTITMSKVFIEESTLTAIGASIRDKTGKQDLISPLNMPTEIESIKGGNIIKTVSGICPITLENCVEGNLLDYKIYGAEGGVGDLENLFDKHYDVGYVGTAPNVSASAGGLSTEWYALDDIGLDFTLALNPNEATTSIVVGYIQSNDKSTIELRKGFRNAADLTINVDNFSNFSISTTQYKYIKFYVNTAAKVNDIRVYKGLNNKLTTPYGFWFPLKVNETEYKLLLDINSSLQAGDYLDFENRKAVINGVTTMVDLPEIPLIEGTNTFNVETTVKPSSVSLTYVKNIEFNTMKTVEGTLPLTVEGVGQKLEDYKIYGNEGGVRNKSKNLFNQDALISGYCTQYSDGTLVKNGNGAVSDYIDLEGASNITITILTETDGGASHPLTFYDADKNYIQISDRYGILSTAPGQYSKTFVVPEGAKYCRFFILTTYTKGNTVWAQIEAGDTFTGYVPYGYEVPLKINDTVYPINIGVNQLGTNDYIDFENRKLVVSGVETLMEFPEIYLQKGQNIIDVDTTVKPSKMSVSFVDNAFDPSHIITKSTAISCENTGTLYNSACEQVIKSPIITNPTGTHLYRWNQLNDNGYISKPVTQNGVTFTNAGNGKIIISGTASVRILMPVVSSSLMSTWDTSHKYYLRQLYPDSTTSTVYWHTFNKQVVSVIMLGSDMNFAANYPRVSVAQNYDTTGIEITPQIFDLTAMFGAGNEPTMEQFDAMFPESYYPFNTGVDIYNLPITINGVVNDIVCADNGTGYIPKEKIIIPEGDVDISLQGTLSGTYLQTVSA